MNRQQRRLNERTFKKRLHQAMSVREYLADLERRGLVKKKLRARVRDWFYRKIGKRVI